MIENQLGTTFALYWPVYIEGNDTPLSEMDLKVFIVHKQFKKEMTITVEDQTISWTFEGKDQVVAGTYDVELYINKGKVDQVLLVNKEVFRLYR